MPAQQRVRPDDRGYLPEGRTADPVRSRGQPPAIVTRDAADVGQADGAGFDLLRSKRNGMSLPAVQPPGEHHEHHLQRGPSRSQGRPDAIAGANDVGRVVEQYSRRLCPVLNSDTDHLARTIRASQPVGRPVASGVARRCVTVKTTAVSFVLSTMILGACSSTTSPTKLEPVRIAPP